jgi:hypothetical protein
MDHFRTRSTYGHLPNFGMLFEKKLYLPNTTVVPGGHVVLGKWSIHWDNTHKHLLAGTVQQDPCGNLTFLITECFEITHCTFQDYSKAPLVPQEVFANYWAAMYQFDPMLSLIQIRVSDFYSRVGSAGSAGPVSYSQAGPVSYSQAGSPEPPPKKQKETPKQAQQIPKPPPPPPPPPMDYFVCKTDKPDVYHVLSAQGQYVSSCLIPNMKISKCMDNLFEHKKIHEPVRMPNLTRHEKSGKFIPTFS